ncbi:MAG: hypothetical protein OEU92_06045 [Alphaproteobacteria bacterium]|nr:hypothetical protein [Alphaproteobacteria bacterium]
MEWLPRAEMRLEDSGAPVVIIDTSLALSPFGLLTTLRLAAADAEVWLTPSLWRRLDEASIEGRYPGLKPSNGEEADAEQRAIVAQWERARLDLGSKPIYWSSDGIDESSLPKGLDASVIARFDSLKAALASACESADGPIEDGDLDSLILSAALTERATAIITLQEDEGENAAPDLVDLANTFGVTCKRLSASAARPLLQHWWRPLLLRAGLMEFFATGGLNVACLRLIAPGAMFFDTEPEDDAAEVLRNWLGGAHVIWSAM